VRIEGDHPEDTARAARAWARRWAQKLPPAAHGVRLLGPAPAPISKIKGKTRWQAVAQGADACGARPAAVGGRGVAADLPASVRVTLDIDPGAML